MESKAVGNWGYSPNQTPKPKPKPGSIYHVVEHAVGHMNMHLAFEGPNLTSGMAAGAYQPGSVLKKGLPVTPITTF